MGFANPAAFFLAALIAVLIAIYFWERQRRRFDVPSLLLWHNVPEVATRRSRFQPNLLFLLQLAGLIALILGFANPYFSSSTADTPKTRQIIVLDTSASMQAVEPDGRRFEQARRAIEARVASLDPASEVMLITVANQPRVALPFTSDRTELGAALDAVEPLDTGTNLEGALALAVRAAAANVTPVRVDLFTDVPISEIAKQWRQQVSIWPVGETDRNLSIEGLRVFQGRFEEPQQARARITVRSHSTREEHGILTMAIGDHLVERQMFSISPGARQSFGVDGFPSGGVLRARLDVDDGLAVDNVAYAWVRSPAPARLLLVSEPSPLRFELESIGVSNPSIEVLTQSPLEYAAQPRSSEIVVFHRYVPPVFPPLPSLFVFPEIDSGILASTGEASDLEILDWNATHPILLGLEPRPPFPLSRAKRIAVPEWAEPLLESRRENNSIALGFAGRQAGTRRAVLSFDLETEGLLAADNESLLLLLLNTVDWLRSDTEPARVLQTGDVTELPGVKGGQQVTDPRGRVTVVDSDEQTAFETLFAGQYEIGAAGSRGRLLANFVNPSESSIGRTPGSPSLAPEPPRSESASIPHGFGRTLFILAAALLLFEWMFAMRET